MRQRIRCTFRKWGAVRFISHHDLMRTMERALRRTALPVRASEGFNPRPKISFPAALGVGIASNGEICEFELEDWHAPEDVREVLSAQMPAGLDLAAVEVIGPREKGTVARATYTVEMPAAVRPDAARLEALLAATEAVVVRRRAEEVKSLNVRPFIAGLRAEGERLVMVLRTSPAGAVRPEEVLQALGVPPDVIKRQASITRDRITLQ